ncbi:YIP1 family protein [Catenovulum agarivorans]|uniref:YIP1 family protein n=1 Tax=Catenovulum agarivorans TaxID=1172192 RepID=UPI0012FC4C19|nr:YIP1 family protein [Catenovulum agarivorans]
MKLQLSLFQDMVTRPKHAFTEIAEKNISSWPAFILIMLSMQLFYALYFNNVDMAWLVDYTVNTSLGQATPAEKEQLSQQLTEETIRLSASIGSVLMLVFYGLITSVYLNVITKLDEQNTDGFKDWFGFYWWVQIPAVLQLALSSLVILVADTSQTPLMDLQVTSLNQILALSPTDKFYNFAASFDLFSIWSIVLLFYGLSVRTQLKTSTIANICIIPFIFMLVFSLVFG